MPATAQIIEQLRRVFERKGWALDAPARGAPSTVFDRFCTMLGELSHGDQLLVVRLMDDFHWHTYNTYPASLTKALNSLPADLVEGAREIILCPILTPKDRAAARVKSSSFLVYTVAHLVIPSIPKLNSLGLRMATTVESLAREYRNRRNSLLLFLDDYAGSGDTVLEALGEYVSVAQKNDDRTCVVTVACMKAARDRIVAQGWSVVADHYPVRGITDRFPAAEVNEALSQMRLISKNLRVSSEYELGYSESEALITMMRTPNNTFPVFWSTSTLAGTDWPAPFPR